MIKMPLSVVRVAAFCLPLALVASCGTGDSEALQGSTINIDPAAVAQTTTNLVGASLVQEPFTIELKSPTGYPQIGIQLTIDTPGVLYVVNTGTSPPTYTAVPTPYTTTTNSNGVVMVAVSFSVGACTSGDITVISAFSGTAYNRTNVTYTAKPISPATC